jgi:hypothetical protein
MKAILICAALMALSVFTGKNELTGKWESPVSPKGNITTVVFKEDNSFEGFVNKKPFVSGHYKVQDSIFSFTDNGCDGKEGVYKILFYSNSDSMRFEPISDSCAGRKEGMTKLVLGRVKTIQVK